MTKPTSTLLPALAIALAALLASEPALLAQTQFRSRLNDRTRATTPPAAPAEAEHPQPARQAPVASTTVAQASGSMIERAQAAAGQLQGRDPDDILRAAQQGINAATRASSPTITESGTGTPPVARPMASEPAPQVPSAAPPVAAPVAAPVDAPSAAAPPAVDIARAAPSGGAIPAPIPMRPRYDRAKKEDPEVMEIESDESIMDNEKRLLIFRGNVVVTEPTFSLTSDELEVWMKPNTADGEADDGPPFSRAIATGRMVEIERLGEDGKMQVAKAHRADYDAVSGDIVLTGGPPTLQSGGNFVNPSSPGAVITLRPNGQHHVDAGKGGRSSVTIELKGSSGGASPSGIPVGGSLDSISNRR